MLKLRANFMGFVALLLLQSTAAAVALALPARGDANAWLRQTGQHECCLLPFDTTDALLPGETLSIHLFDQIAAFETSMRIHGGCVCQLLEHDDGRHCAIAPLLELQEHRRHPDSGVWCAFACVGAARISDVELRTVAEEQTLRGVQLNAADEETMLVASATLLREDDDSMSTVDYDSADDEGAFLTGSVEALHEVVNALRRDAIRLNPSGPGAANNRVTSGGDRLGPPPSAAERVEYGHRLGPLIGAFLTLEEHVALRAETLCTRGPDEPPDADLGRRAQLWGSADLEAARRSLLSFVACEALSDEWRLGALCISDTSQRLEHALAGLRARRAELSAEVALRRLR